MKEFPKRNCCESLDRELLTRVPELLTPGTTTEAMINGATKIVKLWGNAIAYKLTSPIGKLIMRLQTSEQQEKTAHLLSLDFILKGSPDFVGPGIFVQYESLTNEFPHLSMTPWFVDTSTATTIAGVDRKGRELTTDTGLRLLIPSLEVEESVYTRKILHTASKLPEFIHLKAKPYGPKGREVWISKLEGLNYSSNLIGFLASQGIRHSSFDPPKCIPITIPIQVTVRP